MIDANLMKEISDEIEESQANVARAAMKAGILILPSRQVQKNRPVLSVHPDIYDRMTREGKS